MLTLCNTFHFLFSAVCVLQQLFVAFIGEVFCNSVAGILHFPSILGTEENEMLFLQTQQLPQLP